MIRLELRLIPFQDSQTKSVYSSYMHVSGKLSSVLCLLPVSESVNNKSSVHPASQLYYVQNTSYSGVCFTGRFRCKEFHLFICRCTKVYCIMTLPPFL